MLGDSLTEWGNWHELVPEHRVINRGVAGDTSSGVLDRLQEVIDRRPRLVFVMVGTNDIGLQVPPETLLSNLREIVTRLRNASIIPVAQSILFRGGLAAHRQCHHRRHERRSGRILRDPRRAVLGPERLDGREQPPSGHDDL